MSDEKCDMYDTLSECLWELLLQDFHPPLTSRPPQRPAWMPSALRPSHNSGILPRAIRTLIGRRNNRPSLRAMPPCGTSLLAGRQPYQTTLCRISLCTSAPPFRRSRSLLAKAGYTPPTTAPSCSSANRPRNHLWTSIALCCLLSHEPNRIYVLLIMRP